MHKQLRVKALIGKMQGTPAITVEDARYEACLSCYTPLFAADKDANSSESKGFERNS